MPKLIFPWHRPILNFHSTFCLTIEFVYLDICTCIGYKICCSMLIFDGTYCTLFSSIFQKISPFPRYGRLKSKFLCERYSHWIYSSCSIELTKTVNTWSLTASVLRCWDNEGLESWNWTDSITIFITLILFHHINMHHTGQSSSGRDLGMERLAY